MRSAPERTATTASSVHSGLYRLNEGQPYRYHYAKCSDRFHILEAPFYAEQVLAIPRGYGKKIRYSEK